jgi:hypothetical protein
VRHGVDEVLVGIIGLALIHGLSMLYGVAATVQV